SRTAAITIPRTIIAISLTADLLCFTGVTDSSRAQAKVEGRPAALTVDSVESVISSSAIVGCSRLLASRKLLTGATFVPVGWPQCQQNEYFDSITELQWEHVIIDEISVVIGPGETSARIGCGGTSVLIGFGTTSVLV